jgi:hypothetical protein
VVKVVGPDRVEPPPAFRLGLHTANEVAAVLGNHQHASRSRSFANPRRQLGEEVTRRIVHQRAAGVQAKPVQMVLVNPVLRVLDQELPNRPAAFTVEVHRGAPGCPVGLREIPPAELAQVGPVRAQVVVDHVEQHRETERVGPVHEVTEVVRAPVGP